MGKLVSKLGWAGVIAGVAIVAYARRRADKTGRDMGAVLSNLPDELKQSRAEFQQEVKEAVEVGKKAAVDAEADFDRAFVEPDSGISRMPDFLA